MVSGQIQIKVLPSSRLFSLSRLQVHCLDPFAAPAPLDIQARAGARIFGLFNSWEVSQTSIGKRSNRLSRMDKKTGAKKWPRSFSDGDS